MCRHITAILLAGFVLMGCLSCQKGEPRHAINFYHWKSSYQVDEEVRSYTKELGCEKVYLHYYDVVRKDGRVFPVNFIKPIKQNLLRQDSVRIIPVIFIANEVFMNMDESGPSLQELAGKISRLNNTVSSYVGGPSYRVAHVGNEGEMSTDWPASVDDSNSPQCGEIQFDCDWTQTTKENYFAFLSFMKKSLPGVKITSTIRLHQIKDRETMGVPPVDKGYLMCYATSGVDDGSDSNSILDINLLKNYTQDLNSYPLPLDYALPLFSWGIVSNQNGKVKLVNGLTNSDMDETRFKKIGENKYEVLEDCFLNGLYINEGFTVEIEEITPPLLRSAIQYLDEKLNKEYTIVYFHLSKGFLKRYSIDDLK
ncbi:MAG: hypothetical protein IKN77_08985 [Paludibacteraceae bacterium]|nr:hypothetical protein [Paludibacteraceae bacterium]